MNFLCHLKKEKQYIFAAFVKISSCNTTCFTTADLNIFVQNLE